MSKTLNESETLTGNLKELGLPVPLARKPVVK